MRGELTVALRYNVLVLPVLLAIAISWWMWMASWRRSAPAPSSPSGSRLFPVVATLMVLVAVVFAVVRNLPGVDGLRG